MTRYVPPRLEGTPELPAPGIYFGMSDADYHALPALSASGIKKLAASPMLFWANTSWLNAKKRDNEAKERAHLTFGKAYHCRIMEGRDAYASRYAVDLDPADYPDALESTDQIKAAIGRITVRQPVKPVGKSKDDFAAQLTRLNPDPCEDYSTWKVDAIKVAIGAFEEDAPVKPVRKVADELPDGTPYERDAVKADWIAQLMALDPDAQVFANLQAAHARDHAGKTFLSADQHAELEIAALMVERDPELRHAFKGGQAEVVLIWDCPRTGVPMKARVDYLKIKAMVDLKTVANQRERSIEQAIRWEIASYHYNVQPCVYWEGAEIVRQLVRERGRSAVWEHRPFVKAEGLAPVIEAAPADGDVLAWALKWAKHREPDEWLFVFQQKGVAPITRGVWYPRQGTTNMVTGEIVRAAKRRFREFGEAFGVEPWLDVKPTYTIADEDIPQSATEI